MSEKLNIQDMIFKLEQFWASKGCMIMPSYDEQKGAGTMSPYTFYVLLDQNLGQLVMLNLQEDLPMVDMVITLIVYTNTTNSK